MVGASSLRASGPPLVTPVPADGAAQKVVTESRERRALGVVLAIAVPTRGGLVKVGLIAHRLQLCRHLAGMSGMHAIFTPAGRDQDRRVTPAGDRVVIGRNRRKKRP